MPSRSSTTPRPTRSVILQWRSNEAGHYMKFLFYSMSGEGAQVAKKIELEGNEVGIFIKEKVYKSTFDGLLNKVTPDWADKDTIIVFDMSGNGEVADNYRRKGHFVYGASTFADQLEHDRDFGFDCMSKANILTPDTKTFKDFSEGLRYVSENPEKRLVFKPNGSMPCKLTYVSDNPDELLAYLRFVEARFGKEIDSFILQDFVEGSVISSEFYCNGQKFLRPANHTVEVKKSMNDELGPSTGCSGNIVWCVDDDRIISEGVAKAEKLCLENKYIGQIDLNAVVNDSGVYGLEWTPRFGYSSMPTFLTLLKIDLGQFFSDITHGQLDELPVTNDFAGSVRLSIPPYPAEPVSGVDTEEISPNIGVPIQDWEEHQEECYFYEVMLQDDQLCHSGGTGVILEAQGLGSEPDESLKNPYLILKDINIPDKQYRTDLQKVLPNMIEECEDYA